MSNAKKLAEFGAEIGSATTPLEFDSEGRVTGLSFTLKGREPVQGYGHLSETRSGAMTILGHNALANNSVNNTVEATNGSWYSHFIRLYYDDGIAFHTSSSTVSDNEVVYDFANTSITGSQERMRIETNGYVGIGTTSPQNKLSVSDGDQGFEVNPNVSNEVRLNAYDRTNSLFRPMVVQADSLIVRQGSDYGRWDSDGIKFNSDTAATNALDDYETGSFSPILTDGTNNATSYTNQGGEYIKIGDLVNVTFNVRVSNFGSVSGGVYIGNLPFNCTNNQYYQGTLDIFEVATALPSGETCLQTLPNTNRTYLIMGASTTGTHAAMSTTYIDTGTVIRGTMTYTI